MPSDDTVNLRRGVVFEIRDRPRWNEVAGGIAQEEFVRGAGVADHKVDPRVAIDVCE